MAACVVVLVIGWRLLVCSQKPAHLEDIIRAHGYPGLIYGVPQIDPTGTRMVYSQIDELGIGLFLLDLQSGHRRLVHEKVSTDDWFQNVDAWSWSPDGRFFVYTHGDLRVCDGITGREVARLPVAGPNGVAALVWLRDREFVYVSRTGVLHEFQGDPGNHWQEIGERSIRAGADHLTALDETTICWQKANRIWSLNLTSHLATTLFDADTNQLEGFSYSRETKQLLINTSSPQGGRLWTLSREAAPATPALCLETAGMVHEAQWLENSNGICAFLDTSRDQPEAARLKILRAPAAVPEEWFAGGKVDSLTVAPDGRKIFVVGARSNEPAPGIWEWDPATQGLRCVMSGLDYPSPYAMRVSARQETVSLGPGRKFNYYVYEPVNLNPRARQKYPLVLGDTLYRTLDPAYQNRVHGPYWAPLLANAGAYVVIVERPDAWYNEMDHWEEYVDWVYRKMCRNPTVDPHQVFLFATSAETGHLSNLAAENPERWKGLMVLSPGMLPDLKALARAPHPPRILISQGELEGSSWMGHYQAEAAKAGIRLEYFTHEKSSHILLGRQVLGERAEAMADFVFGD